MDIFDHQFNVATPVSARVEIAIRQMEFARRYTLSLLEDLEPDQWYWPPGNSDTSEQENSASEQESSGEYVSHIAWQCGHIAMAQYGLTLFLQRGRVREIDAKLMTGKFRKLFMRGTTPTSSQDDYPDTQEILETLGRVHQQMLTEVPTFDDSELDSASEPPHAGYATRYGALLFAGHHEMLHAGQIGMLRRLMGKNPLR